MFDIEFEKVEASVQHGVEWLRLAIETLGAMVIAFGIAVAVLGIIRHFFVHRGHGFTDIRLAFARYLTLALELQLAADVLSTSIAPTWDRIGKLAAIAVIRTGLNYFLSREMKDEHASRASALPDGSPPDRGWRASPPLQRGAADREDPT
jgi:uncharacterized membrane protein